jgi:hypothetical protein
VSAPVTLTQRAPGRLPTQAAGGHKTFQHAAPAEYRWTVSGETFVSPIFLSIHHTPDGQFTLIR